MGGRRAPGTTAEMVVAVLAVVVAAAAAVLSPAAAANVVVADQVRALVAIRAALRDPGHVLSGWDPKSGGGDPCRWRMVTCDGGGHVSKLSMMHNNLSGTLSPAIGRLRTLRHLSLHQNAISGPIPHTVGRMRMLEVLDLSNNNFSGKIPSTLGHLVNLQHLKLNNNLSGHIPHSLATARVLSLDLSFNNLSGPKPTFRTSTNVFLHGNPLLSGINCERSEPGLGTPNHEGSANSCLKPLSVPVTDPKDKKEDDSKALHFKKAVIICLVVICSLAALATAAVVLFWYWQRRRQRVFAVTDGRHGPEVRFGHLKRYTFDEIKNATNNFCQINILGQGGYGIVYKGHFSDGTILAVKRLKDEVLVVESDQFYTEIEVISLVVHPNLLHLIGFCIRDNERLLVYPYVPNGNVASKLRECVNGEPALDWPSRKRIALGVAQGLMYLHEQCDPKIIHRDIKASNILLDEYLEPIVADFGLAKLIDHGMSHVVTSARGTIGRIPPESLFSSHASEKTDVFGFGLLLIELVTGRETLELHEKEYQEGGILEWAKELLELNQLSSFVDKRLRNNYDSAKLEEMIQIALLCTMYNPDHRPRMSEVISMLEGGDGVAERWETMKDVEEPDPDSPGCLFSGLDYDAYRSGSFKLEAVELSGPR